MGHEFQFLIGSLEARYEPGSSLISRFNSSQVVWKPDMSRGLLLFPVSIPHRQSGSDRPSQFSEEFAPFQFLIGSLEARFNVSYSCIYSSFNSSQVVWKLNLVSVEEVEEVSIPHRQSGSEAAFTKVRNLKDVSIPHRQSGSCSIPLFIYITEKFQFLIGSLEACLTARREEESEVSIPHRQSGSERYKSFYYRLSLVSIPHRQSGSPIQRIDLDQRRVSIPHRQSGSGYSDSI